ncbi:hypothetical protein ABK040_004881 [Willaertia magna]
MVEKFDITKDYGDEMDKTIECLCAPGKGLLAADESTSTIQKRFDDIGVENTEENRQQYRELLFTADKEYANYISGVIMYEETLYQKTKDGRPFVQVLKDHGVIPGIKVDLGTKPIYGTDGEVCTQGFDDLDKRISKYYQQGARFAKWRAVYYIGENKPSKAAMDLNAQGLARYAAVCQNGGLVPIVEPEIMVMEGSHDIDRSLYVTQNVLASVFQALIEQNVNIERIILKPNMVICGNDCPTKSECDKLIGKYTAKCLQRCVPPAVRGIMFLSGGQSEQQAVDTLNDINKQPGAKPWVLTYSYGRALQQSTLHAWRGKQENIKTAQEEYLEQCRKCSKASLGKLY